MMMSSQMGAIQAQDVHPTDPLTTYVQLTFSF